MVHRPPDNYVLVTHFGRVSVDEAIWRTSERQWRQNRSNLAGWLPGSDSRWHEIVQMMHAALPRKLPKTVAVCRDVAAQQTLLAKHGLETVAPNFRAATQSIQNRGNFATDASLAPATQATGVVNQKQIAT